MIKKTQEEIMNSWGVDNSDSPLVSIRCIAYNQEKYVGQTLDGFLMQETNFPFEIIIHDDASTDNTANIIREYEKKFPKIIKPIYEIENQYSKNDDSISNIMNAACKGKYIAYCEGDDYWIDKEKLQIQYNMLENKQDCTIVFNKVLGERNGKITQTIPSSLSCEQDGIVTLENYCKNEFQKGIYTFQTCCFFARGDVYRNYYSNTPDCFKKFPFGDMPFLLYCLTNGNGIYIDKPMSVYRIFSGGFMSRMKANPEKRIIIDKQLIEALKAFDDYTNKTYHTEINGRIVRAYLNIAMLSNDKKLYKQTIKDKAYLNLSLKNRVYYFIRLFFPFIFQGYEKILKR